MSQDRTKRKLVAILSTDVFGYSRLMEMDEEWTVKNLEENKTIIRSLVEEYKGRVVDSPGDNMLAEFSSVVNAVECSVKIQQELCNKNSKLVEERRMHFRIGVNLGDVIEEDGRIYGNGVNIAARLEGLAKPGGICISRTAYDQVKTTYNLEYDYLGEYRVKNISEPVHVYHIQVDTENTGKIAHDIRSQKTVVSLRTAIFALIVILAVAIGSTIAFLYPRFSKPPQVVRFEYNIPEDQKINFSKESFIAVSPDGSQFAYCTAEGIYLRYVNELNAKIIPGSDDRPMRPAFSPDGKWIAYWSKIDSNLKKIPVSGGNPVIIREDLPTAHSVGSLSWNEDNFILFEFGNSIWQTSPDGRNLKPIFEIEGGLIGNPQLLPDGNSVLYANYLKGRTMLYSLDSGKSKLLVNSTSARYVKTGHIIFLTDANIYAVPFDINTLEVTGGPISIINNPANSSSAFQFAVSDSGTLVYATMPESNLSNKKPVLVWVDHTGNENLFPAEPDNYLSVKISPDGKKVALSILDGKNEDIWIRDIDSGNMTKLTFNGASSFPLWTANGDRIIFASAYGSDKYNIFWKVADATEIPDPLCSSEDKHIIPSSLSPKGDQLLMIYAPLKNPVLLNMASFSVIGGKELEYPFQDKGFVSQPKISPDGRWLAYLSIDSGQLEVFVSPFPAVNAGKWKISRGGGNSPLWSPDGRKLFYRNGNKVIEVQVESDTTFHNGKPETIFEGNYYLSPYVPFCTGSWDIHPDDERFLMIKPTGTTDEQSKNDSTPKINIILNWPEELKI